MTYSYRVYVIDLKNTVRDIKKFMKVNPGYRAGKPCVYVGYTGKDPETRFKQHKAGGRLSNNYARRFGKDQRSNDNLLLGPFKTAKKAMKREKEIAEELRSRGWAVWWN